MKFEYFLGLSLKDSCFEAFQVDENMQDVARLEFPDLDDAIYYFREKLSFEKDVYVMDESNCMWLHLKDGKVIDHNFQYDYDMKALSHWKGEKYDAEIWEAYDCTRCHDGGCPSCRPQWYF